MTFYPLHGLPRFYAWGGYDCIRSLFSLQSDGTQPLAEWWMGAHPEASSVVVTDLGPQPLSFAVRENPKAWLGEEMARRFQGTLPFLLKILDVREMLSIQVHPDKAQAETGFLRENEAGIPLTAGNRNYKDPNHKPEMAVALEPVWLLHGFRSAQAIGVELARWPDLAVLSPVLAEKGIEGLFHHVMTLEPAGADALLGPLVAQVRALGELNDKGASEYWIRRADDGRETGFDRGLFAMLMLNIVALAPGQGIYQPARLLHAYLEGRLVELMSTSDNVLRAGLTPKHIDVAELLAIVRCVETVPAVLTPHPLSQGVATYPMPETEFALDVVTLTGNETITLTPEGAEIHLVLEGQTEFDVPSGKWMPASAGTSVFVVPGEAVRLHAGEKGATLVRARTPNLGMK